jgi:hypothetical protein
MRTARVRSAWLGCAALAALTLMTGCANSGNAGGFKAEQKPSKDEINRQIAAVKANPNMPANVKATALKKLEQDLANAR